MAAVLHTELLTLQVEGVELYGDLALPSPAEGLVVFAHGSGSGRHSPRNQQVARALNESGFATLLFDLLTPEEEVRGDAGATFRFDVRALARRLAGVTDWLERRADVAGLPTGYFGASTGAAAALIAAAARPHRVRAVVSRGGRPDLAGEALAHVQAPTLLIVGGADPVVLGLNQKARAQLRAPAELVVVPGATHLFEEPGALEAVAALAREWFERYLSGPAGAG